VVFESFPVVVGVDMTVVVVAFLVVVADAVGMAVEEDVVAFLVVADADAVGMEEDVVDFHSYYQDVLHMVAVDPEDHPVDLLAAAAVDDEMVAVVDDADADYGSCSGCCYCSYCSFDVLLCFPSYDYHRHHHRDYYHHHREEVE
jgi:hypothetical protein